MFPWPSHWVVSWKWKLEWNIFPALEGLRCAGNAQPEPVCADLKQFVVRMPRRTCSTVSRKGQEATGGGGDACCSVLMDEWDRGPGLSKACRSAPKCEALRCVQGTWTSPGLLESRDCWKEVKHGGKAGSGQVWPFELCLDYVCLAIRSPWRNLLLPHRVLKILVTTCV